MTATGTPVTLTREGFLQALRDSNVLTESQFTKAVATLGPRGRSPRGTAEDLVRREFLTRFQAERLLTGRSDGFAIGPYLVLDYMGKSATGRVYKARHTTMNRHVAIKVISSGLTKNDAVREGVRAEARAAAHLAHPNIVTLLDANEAGGRMYFVREFVDGPTLADVVADRGPLPAAEACEYLRQAALGLEHAHEKGIAHGKLSPTAVLIGRPANTGHDQPQVKVSGFGLGRFTADAGETNADYTAPEAAVTPPPGPLPDAERGSNRHCADPRADLYSLGGVLYFALTGKPPVQGAPVLEYLRPDLPAALGDLVRALLAVHPAHRPPSAYEVALQLGAIADAEAHGMIDFSLTAPRTAADSGSLAELSGPVGFSQRELPPAADEATSWGNIVAAHETSDGIAADDPTPVGIRKRPPAMAANLLALALVVAGVMVGVLIALFLVLRAFAH